MIEETKIYTQKHCMVVVFAFFVVFFFSYRRFEVSSSFRNVQMQFTIFSASRHVFDILTLAFLEKTHIHLIGVTCFTRCYLFRTLFFHLYRIILFVSLFYFVGFFFSYVFFYSLLPLSYFLLVCLFRFLSLFLRLSF